MKNNQKMQKFIKNELEENSPSECNLEVGDLVSWTNDYGVEWEHRIIGFNYTREYNKEYKKFVHLNTDSYWFPHGCDELTKSQKKSV